MEIHKIKPQGYCGGVKRALKLVQQLLEQSDTPKPIYMLGSIIHNQHVIDELISKGIIVIDSPNKTRLELLNQISSGTVIFSAHGVSPIVKEKAIEKGLNILDTTCKNVEIIHNNMKKYLTLGYQCCYIGTQNHPECEGVLGIDSNIHLINSVEDINSISSASLYVTNQTTLSYDETKELYECIHKKFSNAILDNKICNATTIRQEAMRKQPKVDFCIVVGDKKSSNTKKLVEVSSKAGIQTHLISDLSDLEGMNFNKNQKISISSGASTPNELVDQIIAYIKERVEN